MIVHFFNIIFNGISYGMLLFLMAAGLSITMGLMAFANLAHAAFAMLGGYLAVILMRDAGWPYLATLPIVFIAVGAVSMAVERFVFRYFYTADELDQVLLTIGFLFISIACATFLWGAAPQAVKMPRYLLGELHLGPLNLNVYRLFLLIMGGGVTAILIATIDRTNIGALVRAAVDNRRMTVSCGVNVDRLFTMVFAAGGALAGLGGALSVNLIGLDPYFPLRYLILMLLVVVIGGSGSIKGTLLAAIVLGILDVTGKYYLPAAGAFIIYAVAVAFLVWRPGGLLGRRMR